MSRFMKPVRDECLGSRGLGLRGSFKGIYKGSFKGSYKGLGVRVYGSRDASLGFRGLCIRLSRSSFVFTSFSI